MSMSSPTDGLHWTILCPGPSLWKLDAIEVPGPVVAVNLAIEHPTEADYWCVNDGAPTHKRIWEGLSWQECNEFPIVWSLWPEGFVKLGFRVHPTGGGQWFHKKMPFPVRRECYINPTTATAIGRTLMHNPSEVTIYGCDMEGDGYGGKEWWPQSRGEEQWARERRQIHSIVDDFSELMGIEINLVRKELSCGVL